MNSQESSTQFSQDFGLKSIFDTQGSEDSLLASQTVSQAEMEPQKPEGNSADAREVADMEVSGGRKSYGPVQSHRRLLRSAEFIIRKSKGILDPSSAQLKSLEWANSIILQKEPKSNSRDDAPSTSKAALRKEFGKKRERSEEEGQGVSSKKHIRKVSKLTKPPPTFCDAAKESLKIAVVDKSTIDGKIPDDKWEIVISSLRDSLFDLCDKPDALPPQFAAMSWYKGIRVIDCSNQYSLDYVKSTILAMGSLWDGSNLAVISKSEIPELRRGRIFVPPPCVEPQKFLKLLAFQNTGLPAEELRFVRAEPKENGQNYVFDFGKKAEQFITDRNHKLIFTMGLVNCAFYSPKVKMSSLQGEVMEVDAVNRDSPSVTGGDVVSHHVKDSAS